MTNLLGKQTSRPKSGNGYEVLIGILLASIWKITSAATLLVSIFCMAAPVGAQTEQPRQTTVVQDMATVRMPAPQLEFVGKEAYEVNGSKATRYKLSVTNRDRHPDFLWQPSRNLAPCGKNENASRTWVEIFGSPGDNRLRGFCGLRSSEDLDRLWFVAQAGEKPPPCVYIVMTDRQSGKKYVSNRVCSRSFTGATDSLKAGGKQEGFKERPIELQGWDWEVEAGTNQSEKGLRDKPGTSHGNVQGGFGSDKIGTIGFGNKSVPDSSGPTNKTAKMAKPDLIVKQFLFPPTNDKALRVHVVNTGHAASRACRLILTVRKINGVAAGRQTHVNVPALAAGANVWLVIDAKSILPNNVSLQSTTFKLNVDATAIVAESDESNNEVWHNL